MWNYSDIVRKDGKGLKLEMTFTHSKGGGTWRIAYKLRRRAGKLMNLFNIYAPDRFKPRREHRLDTVMLVIKNACFHDRYNTTGNVSFSTFKYRLREIIGAEETDKVSRMFAERIKEEITAKV